MSKCCSEYTIQLLLLESVGYTTDAYTKTVRLTRFIITFNSLVSIQHPVGFVTAVNLYASIEFNDSCNNHGSQISVLSSLQSYRVVINLMR
jgi:hypothetical protein